MRSTPRPPDLQHQRDGRRYVGRVRDARLSGGKATTVTLKLSRKDASAVRKALKHHKLKAKVNLTLKDAAGNQTVKKLSLALRR